MINLDDTQGGSGLLPRLPGTGPSWPNLGQDEPLNVQQEYMAQRRALESDRLSKLYLDDKEFARLANQSEIREGSRLSLLGEDLPKVALNAAYLSHRMGRKVTASEYELARDSYAAANFGQEAVTDGQFFDLVKGEYDVRRQKTEALDELRLRMATQSLEDGVAGADTPAVDTWKAWKEKHRDLVGDEDDLPYLAAAVGQRNEFKQVVDKYKHLAAPGLDLLKKFTAGEASGEELSDFARTLAGVPREEQDMVIDLIALGADGGQIDRGALKEFASSLGQTFSRGFNFIPQRVMQDRELGVTNFLEAVQNGVEVYIPVGGDIGQAVVGNAPAGAAEAALAEGSWRQATEQEREQMVSTSQQALAVFRIERQLRSVADNNVDPIKRYFKGGIGGAIEGGALGVAGSLPLLTATAVNPFAGMVAYQSMEYDRMLNENPDMNVRAALGVAAVEGAWQAALDRLQLRTLQGALPVTGRLLGKIKSTGLRRTVGFAASGAEQFGQELAQDIGTLAIDAIASSLREDMKDKDFTLELGEYWKQAPEVLVASLIFGMWGGGAITARELRGTPAEWDEAARIAGISEDGRKRMRAATTPEELDTVVERELKAVTPESQAAGALYAKAKRQAAEAAQADPNEPTLEVIKDEEGNSLYRITTPDGETLVETRDAQAAQAAFLDYRTAAETNEVQALKDVISYWQDRDPELSIEQAPAVLVKEELDRLEGIGDAAGIERLRQRLVAADIDPDGDLTGVQIFGSTTVQEVGENVYRGTILVRQGAAPETVLEEVNHAFVRRALLRGDVTLDTLSDWLEQTAAATGLDIKRGNEIEIIESIAQVGMDLFNGRLDQAQLPQSLVDYLRRLMRVVKEIYARAIKVTEAFDRGEIDGNFEQFLMQSMGMDPQQQIDLNSSDTAAKLSTGAPEDLRGPDGLTDDERYALEQELLADMEEEAAEAAGAGGTDILDAVREAGGLPSMTSSKVKQYAGELKNIREAQKPGNAVGVKGAFNLFRKNAPDMDGLIKDLQDMGFRDITTPSELFEVIDRRLRTGRKIYGYGRAMADYSVGRAPRLKSAVAAIHEEALSQRDKFLRDITTAARRAGGRAVQEKFKSAVKKLVTSINKIDRKPSVPSDLLRASIEAPAGGPEAARRVAIQFIESMRRQGYELYAPGGKPDITDRHVEGAEEYVDIALKFVRAGAGLDPVVKEVLVVQPAMLKAKSQIHTFYGRWRDALKRYGTEADNDRIQQLLKVAQKSEAEMRKLAKRAYALDSRTARIQPLSAVQSSDDISSGSLGMSMSGMPSFASSATNPASATERAVSFVASAFSIRGNNTSQAAGGQGRITSENIGEYAGDVDMTELAKYPDALRQTFNISPGDRSVQVVPLSSLVSLKNELEDPRFLAGTKKDPRQTAADAMVRNIESRGGKKRDPLDVADNGDGTYTIRDGNATAQAAMLAGWTSIPVKVEGAVDFSIGRQSYKDWFGDWENDPANASKVIDASGRPLVVYHGTRRPDRVGNRFRKSRATSGPMAFFTDTAGIASSYAEGKADTSLEMPDDYAGWFKFKGKGMRSAVALDRAWFQLSQAERGTINQRIYTVGYQNADEASGPIVADSSSIMGRDSIAWQLREARGNALRALVEIWLNSGSLFNDEQVFMQVLEAVGMDMSRVTYDSPHAVKSAVYPVYLSIKNPLDTENIPPDVLEALKQAGKRKRAKRSAGGNADAWDKNTISGKDWLDTLTRDVDNGSSHAWTRIPDWVTETLEQLGYDGVMDTGGKFGGPKHRVWIPFNESQVKSATGNRGTFDPTDPRIDYSLGRARATFADQLEELQAGESNPVDTSKTFWLIASSSGDLVDILDNEQDAELYFRTTASTGEWLWEYKNGLRTEVPLLKRGVAERRAEGYIDTVRYEQERREAAFDATSSGVFYGADTSPETATSAGEIPSYTPDGQPWAGQEESVVYHGGRLFDPQGTDPGGYGETQTLKPRRPDQTYLFSVGRSRVDRALASAMNRKPGERLAMYERAKEMFDRVAARRGETTGPDGYARTLQSLWELDAILKVLPAEVRGKVGGFTRIAELEPVDLYRGDELLTESNSPAGARIAAWMREGLNIGEAGKKTELPEGYSIRRNTEPARATKATDDFLVKRLATVGKQLDRYLANEYRIAIERTLEAARPKRSESGVRKSTLGPETQAYADKALAASNLDNDQTAQRLVAIEAELLDANTTDERKLELVEEWGLVNTFGDIEGRNAETLAQGYGELKARLKAGRDNWRIQQEARIAGQRETIAKLILALGEPSKSKRFETKATIAKLGEWLTAAGLDHTSFEQFIRALGFDEATVGRWSDMMRKADTGAQDMDLAMRDQLLEAVKAAAKSAGMSRSAALAMLKRPAQLKVRAMKGRKVTDERISIELAQKIVRGTADRSKLSDADVATLREALADLPADTRKKFVTIQRVISAGNPEILTMTPAQAMQLELSWDQPDVQEKMRREGWTDESIEDIRAITSQPVASETLAFLRKFYAENYAQVNPVYARMFGMNMPQAKFYAPSRFVAAGKQQEIGLDGSPQVTGSTPGFAKSRVRHASPIAAEDALTVFQQHVVQSAHWINFAEFAREARAVTSNLELRESVKQRFGEATLNSLDTWVEMLEQRGANKSREAKWFSDLLGSVVGGTAISSLGFSLKTVLIQGDSAMRFMLAMDPRQIGSALSDPIALAAAMPKIWFSPSVQRRLKGGMNPAAQFLFARSASKPGLISNLAALSMKPMQLFDAAATTISSAMVFRAAFNDAKDAGMDDAGAEAVALDAMDAAIYRFSQPTGLGSKSNLENAAGPVTKMFTLFLSDPRLKTSVLVDAVRDIARGKNVGMAIQRILVIEALALVSHVIASAYRDAFSDEEDEDIWSVGGFVRALALAPLQGFFLAGTLAETTLRAMAGERVWAPSRDLFARNIESGIRAAASWEKLIAPEDAAEGLRAWNNALRGIAFSTPFGAPAALLNILKPFIGLQQNLEADE